MILSYSRKIDVICVEKLQEICQHIASVSFEHVLVKAHGELE